MLTWRFTVPHMASAGNPWALQLWRQLEGLGNYLRHTYTPEVDRELGKQERRIAALEERMKRLEERRNGG